VLEEMVDAHLLLLMLTPSHLLCYEQTPFTSRKPTAKEHSIRHGTMPGNSHENKCLFVAPKHFNRPARRQSPCSVAFKSAEGTLKRPFLAAIWELIHSLLGRPTSQAAPPVLRSAHAPDNPPRNM